ncbi:hypothetical protein YYE_03151 [Plasmodium vinckei vinckei]|nr:hypothetical protein YYE_03151 [Plasmodium vinckei vinckei]
MSDQLCKILIEVDEYFTNEIVDEGKFNKNKSLQLKCPQKGQENKCTTNNERINALGEYLYQNLPKNAKDLNADGINNHLEIEFFMMWLSDKLFKTNKDYTETLEESYKKHLRGITGKFEYWDGLNSKEVYKSATIVRMSQFHNLLNNICKTINEYNKNLNNPDIENLKNYADQCLNLYRNIHESVKECKSYMHLLDSLKTIYEYLKSYKIPDNKNLDNSIKVSLFVSIPSLTTSDYKNEYFVRNYETLSFDGEGCGKIKLKDEEDGKKSPSTDSQSTQQGNGLPKKPKTGNQAKHLLTPALQRILEARREQLQKAAKKRQLQTRSRPKPQSSPPENVKSTPAQTEAVNSPLVLPQAPANHDPESSKGNTLDGTRDAGGGIGGASDGKGGKDNAKIYSNSDTGVKSSGASGGKTDGEGSGERSTDITKGDVSNGSGGTSSGQDGDPGTGTDLQTVKTEIQIMGNDAYNSVVTIVKDTYDSTVTTVKNTYDNTMITVKGAYSATTSYIGSAVSSITNQLNSFGTSSTSGDDQSGSGGSGNDSSTGNTPSNIPQIPKSDSNSPSSPYQSQSPSSSTPLVTTQSQPSLTQDAPPNTQSPISQPQSVPTHDSLQIIDQNGGPDPVQSHDTNPGVGMPKTLTNSSIGPSTTGNGSTTGTVVKMNENPSIWCIAPNKKCDLVGIGVISISIFVFLTIMYKYLSFGSSKKSEKKNMKRVINFHDGNRKTKIIISSNDKKKKLKPIINSIGGKKGPLLNIYKLIHADPIPFINLFFLLIFFVYKRKRDTIEL